LLFSTAETISSTTFFNSLSNPSLLSSTFLVLLWLKVFAACAKFTGGNFHGIDPVSGAFLKVKSSRRCHRDSKLDFFLMKV